MRRLATFAALALASSAAMADTVDISGSTVTLQPTTRAGAIAEVVFANRNVNDHWDETTYRLTLGGLTLPLSFDWDADGGSDAVTIRPPEGVTCLPASCVLELPENDTGTLFLFSVTGVGM